MAKLVFNPGHQGVKLFITDFPQEHPEGFYPDYAQNEPAERWSRSFAAPVIE
jgi:hypothetical protein